MTRLNSFAMEAQPPASEATLEKAIISYGVDHGVYKAISYYGDDVWEAAPVGALADTPPKSRQIDFTAYPLQFRQIAKRILYCTQRHPLRISTTPSFATLLKRNQHLLLFFRTLDQAGVKLADLSPDSVESYLKTRALALGHIETLVGAVSILRHTALYFKQGLIPFDVAYPFPTVKGSKAVAKKIWRDAYHKDFSSDGEVPYSAEDIVFIMRNAHFFVEKLGPVICEVLGACVEIRENYPAYRQSRSQESLCYRAQKEYLNSLNWDHSDLEIKDWPPKNFRDVLKLARKLSAASMITICFPTGCRRSELNSIEDDCISKDRSNNYLLELKVLKGQDELYGRLERLPVDERVVAAVNMQSLLKQHIGRHMHVGRSSNLPSTRNLFVQVGSSVLGDFSDATGMVPRTTMADGRLTSNAINSILENFRRDVVPFIDGTLNVTRFRKTIAHLITLSMEGSMLILQNIFGHKSYRTTLGYMFASPLITQELVDSYPELIAKNLRILYNDRDSLMGGAAPVLRASILTGPEIEMTEDEFVELGLEMMKNGQMILSVLGTGIYCLKPAVEKGPCNVSSDSILPNAGRCNPRCDHHLILGAERPKLVRTVVWLNGRIQDSSTSEPVRDFYSRYMADLTYVLEKT